MMCINPRHFPVGIEIPLEAEDRLHVMGEHPDPCIYGEEDRLSESMSEWVRVGGKSARQLIDKAAEVDALLAAKDAEIARLRAYVTHTNTCAVWHKPVGPCSCGLRAALGETEA